MQASGNWQKNRGLSRPLKEMSRNESDCTRLRRNMVTFWTQRLIVRHPKPKGRASRGCPRRLVSLCTVAVPARTPKSYGPVLGGPPLANLLTTIRRTLLEPAARLRPINSCLRCSDHSVRPPPSSLVSPGSRGSPAVRGATPLFMSGGGVRRWRCRRRLPTRTPDRVLAHPAALADHARRSATSFGG
jgi:hypothetical protein